MNFARLSFPLQGIQVYVNFMSNSFHQICVSLSFFFIWRKKLIGLMVERTFLNCIVVRIFLQRLPIWRLQSSFFMSFFERYKCLNDFMILIYRQILGHGVLSVHYFNVRNFRVQKISQIRPFAKFRVF